MMSNFFRITCVFVVVLTHYSRACPNVCSCVKPWTNCTERNILSIPNNIPLWTEKLFLNRNRIRTLNHSYNKTGGKLSLLQLLDLRNNQLGNISTFSFVHFSNMETLYLDHNHIEIRDAQPFERLPSLQEISLSFNNLNGEIQADVFGYVENLQVLNLSHNKIESFQDLSLPLRLKTLDISYNNISQLDQNLLDSHAELEELDMRGLNVDLNNILLFNILFKLKVLKLGGKTVTSIHESLFFYLHSLEILEIVETQIRQLPVDLLRYSNKLTELNLSNNQLSYFNETFFLSANQIKVFNLNGNQFTSLKDISLTTRNLRLTRLDLGNNLIEGSVSVILSNQTKLQYLSLSRNKLKALNSTLSSNSLLELDLSYNVISLIKYNTFKGCTALQRVNLIGNQLSFLPTFTLTTRPYVSIVVNNNPWNCTCNLYKYIIGDNITLRTLKTRITCSGFSDFSCIICRYQNELRNQTLKVFGKQFCESEIASSSNLETVSIYYIAIGAVILILLMIACCCISKHRYQIRTRSNNLSGRRITTNDDDEIRERNSSNAAFIMHAQPLSQNRSDSVKRTNIEYQSSTLLGNRECHQNKSRTDGISSIKHTYLKADENANSFERVDDA